MWMEETIGTRVNEARSRELVATGAQRIATACPYCYIMIDDGVKAQGVEDDEVKVADIAMHLVEALERGEAEPVMEAAPAAAQPITTGPAEAV
jgi:Fe-S oxidoreductase